METSQNGGFNTENLEQRIPTGCLSLDMLLRGGFSRGQITLIYGEAATGKTTAVIQTATSAATMGLKVLYVDSDHSFTHQRFQQIAKTDPRAASELIMLFLPETFAEQRALIESFENYVTPSLGLVIIDSISSLYRAAFTRAESIFTLNRDLSRQLAYLGELSATSRIACIVTSQVHSRLTPPLGDVEPVARRALFHFPRAILRIRNTPRQGVKEFALERIEGSDVRGSSCLVALTDTGLEDLRT
jgi:DNA repair protein RadB